MRRSSPFVQVRSRAGLHTPSLSSTTATGSPDMLQRIASRLRDARDNETGFTVIEVMVAMVVFALIAVGVAGAVATSLSVTSDSRAREVATGIASEFIDAARTSSDSSLFSIDKTTQQVVRSGATYTVMQEAHWQPISGVGDTCGAGGGPLADLRISATVSWRSGGAARSLTMNSIVAPTTSVSAAGTGTIIVEVNSASGAGNQGVTVTIKPNATPNGATAITTTIPVTNSLGCTYATSVMPGSYDVTITEAGGIDDGTTNNGPQVNAPTKKSIGVTANSTAVASFLYDQSTSYRLHYQDPNATNTAFVLPSNISAALWHKSYYYKSLTASSVSMFPFADGYYAAPSSPDTCAMVDPGNWTTPVGSAVAPADKQWYASSSGTDVYIPIQTVTVKLGGITDTAITAAQTNSSSTPGCASTTTYSFTGLTPGGTYTIGLPYGSYTLSEGTVLFGAVVLSTGVPSVTAATGVTYNQATRALVLDPRRVPA
jgi:prepilin-type N-terminal cleavage/methylation domain-containing protein